MCARRTPSGDDHEQPPGLADRLARWDTEQGWMRATPGSDPSEHVDPPESEPARYSAPTGPRLPAPPPVPDSWEAVLSAEPPPPRSVDPWASPTAGTPDDPEQELWTPPEDTAYRPANTTPATGGNPLPERWPSQAGAAASSFSTESVQDRADPSAAAPPPPADESSGWSSLEPPAAGPAWNDPEATAVGWPIPEALSDSAPSGSAPSGSSPGPESDAGWPAERSGDSWRGSEGGEWSGGSASWSGAGPDAGQPVEEPREEPSPGGDEGAGWSDGGESPSWSSDEPSREGVGWSGDAAPRESAETPWTGAGDGGSEAADWSGDREVVESDAGSGQDRQPGWSGGGAGEGDASWAEPAASGSAAGLDGSSWDRAADADRADASWVRPAGQGAEGWSGDGGPDAGPLSDADANDWPVSDPAPWSAGETAWSTDDADGAWPSDDTGVQPWSAAPDPTPERQADDWPLANQDLRWTERPSESGWPAPGETPPAQQPAAADRAASSHSASADRELSDDEWLEHLRGNEQPLSSAPGPVWSAPDRPGTEPAPGLPVPPPIESPQWTVAPAGHHFGPMLGAQQSSFAAMPPAPDGVDDATQMLRPPPLPGRPDQEATTALPAPGTSSGRPVGFSGYGDRSTGALPAVGHPGGTLGERVGVSEAEQREPIEAEPGPGQFSFPLPGEADENRADEDLDGAGSEETSEPGTQLGATTGSIAAVESPQPGPSGFGADEYEPRTDGTGDQPLPGEAPSTAGSQYGGDAPAESRRANSPYGGGALGPAAAGPMASPYGGESESRASGPASAPYEGEAPRSRPAAPPFGGEAPGPAAVPQGSAGFGPAFGTSGTGRPVPPAGNGGPGYGGPAGYPAPPGYGGPPGYGPAAGHRRGQQAHRPGQQAHPSGQQAHSSGQQAVPPAAQNAGPPPTVEQLTAQSLLRHRRAAPQTGWRRAVYNMSAHTVNPGQSAEDRRRQELIARASVPVPGCYRIAVISLKGGVGKTTTTVTLGATLASLRGDRVIAVDANPDRGTLSGKIPLETVATVRNLLNDVGSIQHYFDVRRYTSQSADRLEVLASESDPAVSTAFSEADYRTVAAVLERFYNIVLTDCGTGLLHSAMAGVLDLADQIVLVSSGSVDGARSASATLDWLEAHGRSELVRNSVAVINSVRPKSGGVDLDRLEEHFVARCRAVTRIPYDPHLEEGAEVDLGELSGQSRAALLELAAYVADAFPRRPGPSGPPPTPPWPTGPAGSSGPTGSTNPTGPT